MHRNKPSLRALSSAIIIAALLPAAPKLFGDPPSWVFAASVDPPHIDSASMALAKAMLPAVFVGSQKDGLYVHPADRARAIQVLKADAKKGHYALYLSGPAPKTKKPSP